VLQDLTFYLDQNAPVYLTGLDYQNFDTTPFQNPRTAYGTAGTNVNLTPELTFQLRARLDSLVTIKMGVSASMISQFLNGTVFAPSPIIPFGGFIGWFHDILSLDFHPSSPSALYVALTTQITVTKALVAAEGKVAKFRGIFINIWDNDPADAQRVLRLRANTELFIASLRNFIGDQTVPVSLSGPSRYGGTDAQREIIYEMGVQLVENETNAGLVDTRVGFTYPTDYAIDGLHYAASGQIKLAQGHFAVWDTVQTLGLTNNAVDICNLALSHIGESSKVTSLDTTVDLSTQARHCARFYPRAVGFLLEQHDWGFNTRRKPLVLNTNPSASLLVQTAEWDFAYDLPNLPHNFATSIAVLPPGSSRDAPTQPYEIETDLAGHKLLLTDVEDAVLRYTVKVSNPQRFSESFIQAAAWMLASMLAGPIVKGAEGKKAAADCLLMMQTFLRKAEAHDSNQKKTDHEVEAPWMPGGEMPGWPARWDPNAHG
jgi:hypothetical protein